MNTCLDDIDLALVLSVGTLRRVIDGLKIGGNRWWVDSDLDDDREATSLIVGYGDQNCVDSLNTSRFELAVLSDEVPIQGSDKLLVLLHPSTVFTGEPAQYMDRCPTTAGRSSEFDAFYFPLRNALVKDLLAREARVY